jgi:nitrite reductase (NADH) small subunit
MLGVSWIDVGALSDIPSRGARRICLGGKPIAIFRTGADEVFALVDRCPHRAGPLSEGIVSGRAVTCPLHNWTIDLASGKACAPDEGSTEALAVKLDGDHIFVAIPAPHGMTLASAGAAA